VRKKEIKRDELGEGDDPAWDVGDGCFVRVGIGRVGRGGVMRGLRRGQGDSGI
jgi:hypothetical protein